MVKVSQTLKPKTESRLDSFYDALGNKSASTISGYRTAIWAFILFIFPNAKKDQCAQLVDEYFFEERDYFTDFKRFIQANLGDKAPLSALQTFNQIRNFFALCDEEFSTKQIKLLKNQLPTGGVMTQEADLDTETIRAILHHCDVKMKAIVLCLASGGMRIGELLNVRCADVDLKSVPAVIQIRAKINGKKTKTGMQRYTFVSSEAVAALREWIKIRPSYLESASKMGKNFKTKQVGVSVDDDRLFPVSDNSVNDAFKEAVVAVFGTNELDPTTGRSTHHVHQFRKFFISQLALTTSEAVADFFAGHKTGLSDNYRRYTTKQMAEYYLKGEHLLFIEAPAELREAANTTKKEIATMKEDTLKNHSVLLSLMNEKDALREKVKQQDEEMAQLRSKIGAAENWWMSEGSKMMEQMVEMKKQVEELTALYEGATTTKNFLANQANTLE